MIFLIAFAAIGLAFVGLYFYERHRGKRTESSESDTYAMSTGAAFGSVIGQAQLNKLGVKGDEVTVREELEPVKFKFED